MRYVQRDKVTNKIVGTFANPQPGYAEEALADDHEEVVAFQTERASANQKALDEKAAFEARVAALESQVADIGKG